MLYEVITRGGWAARCPWPCSASRAHHAAGADQGGVPRPGPGVPGAVPEVQGAVRGPADGGPQGPGEVRQTVAGRHVGRAVPSYNFV